MIELVAGLGNIGPKYAETRHNLGFELLEIVADRLKASKMIPAGSFIYASAELKQKTIRLIWPVTYMNNSGLAVTEALERFELSPEQVLVAFDDFNLPMGKIRLRTSGSDGGHNGLESIIYHLQTENIPRLRMGIGPIPPDTDPVEFVLGRFSHEEVEIKKKMLEFAADSVLYSLTHRLEESMSLYNRTPAPDQDQDS